MKKLTFFGPALGGHDGWVTTQGEVLAALFADDGFPVLVSSTNLSPVRRAADHAGDVLRWRRTADVAIVSVFSGRAFALADEALTLARALGIPTIAWLHGGNLPTFESKHPRWVRRVLSRADAVVAPSGYLARWADTVVPGARVIPNVLDLSAYRFRVRTPLHPRLLWMRTFQELYDPGAAVRAVASLRDEGIDVTLTMAGQDKGLLESTRVLAQQLSVSDRIDFPGFVSGAAKSALLDANDIFLNTNLVDNAPVTVLEAAASGLVIVSTDVGGIPDLLADGISARLVPAGQPVALAGAVADLLRNQAKATELSAAAAQVAAGSSWEAVRDQWLELIGALSR